MSRKIDVKLPHEMGDYGDWRERFDKPLLHKKITEEDKPMAIIKSDQVVKEPTKPESVDITFDDELKDELQVFETIERETKLILKAVEDYRCLAQVSYQTLGLDKGKPIVDVIYKQLKQEVSQILEVGA